jgi:hypothetical protein
MYQPEFCRRRFNQTKINRFIVVSCCNCWHSRRHIKHEQIDDLKVAARCWHQHPLHPFPHYQRGTADYFVPLFEPSRRLKDLPKVELRLQGTGIPNKPSAKCEMRASASVTRRRVTCNHLTPSGLNPLADILCLFPLVTGSDKLTNFLFLMTEDA